MESRFASIETIKAGDSVCSDWDMERMKQGKAPQKYNKKTGKWESKELHHKIPRRKGGSDAKQNLREVWPEEHAKIDPHRHVRR